MAQSTQCTVYSYSHPQEAEVWHHLIISSGPMERLGGVGGGRGRENGQRRGSETRIKSKTEGKEENRSKNITKGLWLLHSVEVLKTEGSENNPCSQCNNPSYARSEKRSGWGNKLCSGFDYSHMTKNHSLSALTGVQCLSSLIRQSTHTQTLWLWD